MESDPASDPVANPTGTGKATNIVAATATSEIAPAEVSALTANTTNAATTTDAMPTQRLSQNGLDFVFSAPEVTALNSLTACGRCDGGCRPGAPLGLYSVGEEGGRGGLAAYLELCGVEFKGKGKLSPHAVRGGLPP